MASDLAREQGAGERHLHPLSPVLDLIRVAPQILVVVVVGGVSQLVLLPIVVVVGVVVLGWRYLAWQRFTYGIDGDALVVRSGLLERSRKVVPLDRIQQVDVQRKVRHQLTGLAVVRVDTAGGGSTAEVILDAVSLAEAEALRSELRRAGPSRSVGGAIRSLDDTHAEASGAPVADEEPERLLVEVGNGRLALAGITGSRLLMVFVAIGSIFGFVEEIRQGTAVGAARDVVESGARPGAVLIGVVLVVAVPVWLGVAAGAAILADGGFRLTRRGDHLRVRRGLLDQREASLLVHRVQAVRVEQNALRRALGLVSVSLQSAGGSGPVEGEAAGITVPLLREADLDALLAEILPHAPSVPELPPAPPAARRRAIVRRLVPALVVAVPVAILLPPAGLLALVLPVLAVAHGEMAYRGLGWAEVGAHVVTRHGALGRETALVPVAKAQSTRLTSSPFQRRAGLATLHLDVAGRGRTPSIPDGDGGELARLRHDALDTRGARRDERAERERAAARVRDEIHAG